MFICVYDDDDDDVKKLFVEFFNKLEIFFFT